MTNLRHYFESHRLELITFPKEEHIGLQRELKERGWVTTFRVSKEYGKYRLNHHYVTEWGEEVVVSQVDRFISLEEVYKKYPYYETELTEEQKVLITEEAQGKLERLVISEIKVSFGNFGSNKVGLNNEILTLYYDIG